MTYAIQYTGYREKFLVAKDNLVPINRVGQWPYRDDKIRVYKTFSGAQRYIDKMESSGWWVPGRNEVVEFQPSGGAA